MFVCHQNIVFTIHYNYVSISFVPHVDINECATGNGGCAQTCTNTIGSYQCSCGTGYALNSNGRVCDGKRMCVCVFVHGMFFETFR